MSQQTDEDLVLDGNAAAGLLGEVFGVEMTAAAGACDHCGTTAAVGSLVAYTRAPGVVLRCRACSGVMVRIAQTPRGTVIDVRGTRQIRVPPTT